GRMERTRHRPLSAGRLHPLPALALALVLLLGGLLLSAAARPLALGLGVLAVALYNGAYTLLKPRTLFALLPGALAGALPLLIGGCAAGASLADPTLLLPAACLFLWQIPHFWLLANRYQEELRQAGLPLPEILGNRRAHRVLATWLFCLAAGAFATLSMSPTPAPLAAGGGLLLSIYLIPAALTLYRHPSCIPVGLPKKLQLFMFGFALLLTTRSLI
ncbi:MAG: UbiA family prenyltransferase, partial [Desulfuromonadales bacterium]|nr:UbiA family prenyltransferase [Desulfuromonadales bacterium]